MRGRADEAGPVSRVWDGFHVLRHVHAAADKTGRAEFVGHGGGARGLLRGKRWLLMRRWAKLDRSRGELFALNRRLAQGPSPQGPTRPTVGLHGRSGRDTAAATTST
jgi:hypothetical protein